MLAAIRLTAQVLLGVALFEVALGALWPLVGLQLEQQRVSTELTSIVGSAYYAGFVLGTCICFPIIDRVGHIRAFSVFAVLAANATLLHVVLPNPIAWAVLRAIIGYALAGVFTIVESWLNDKATTETRGRIFALYTMVAWGVSGIGPLGLNIHDPSGTILFCLIGIVMASAIIPIALTTVGNPDIGHRTHFGILRLYTISPLGVLACFASGLINTGLFVLLPIYSTRLGLQHGADLDPAEHRRHRPALHPVSGRLAGRPIRPAAADAGHHADRDCAVGRRSSTCRRANFYWLVGLIVAARRHDLAALRARRRPDQRLCLEEGFRRRQRRPAVRLGHRRHPSARSPPRPPCACSAIRTACSISSAACHVLLAGFIAYRMIVPPRPVGEGAEQLRGGADAAHASCRPGARPARRASDARRAAQASRIISATVRLERPHRHERPQQAGTARRPSRGLGQGKRFQASSSAACRAPGDGEVLVRNLSLSLDPYMRGRINAPKSYANGVELGR